jgi:hypothetical protein
VAHDLGLVDGKQGGAEPPRMIGYQPTIKSHADTMQLPVNLGLGMAILPSVNVTWDSFTPSEVNMAEVACCKELTCVLSDWMIFDKALRAPVIGMTLFSHAAGIFRRKFCGT